MLPRGIYPVVVVPQSTDVGLLGCQFGKASTSNLQVSVMFEVIHGPHAGERITWFGVFTDTVQASGKTVAERTLESLRVCGFKGDDLDKFADQHPDIEVSITVDHEEYPVGSGKTQVKVKWINDPNRGITMANPVVGSDLRKYAAQFKAKLRGIPAVAGTKAVREAPTAAPAGASDEWSGNDAPDPPKPGEY